MTRLLFRLFVVVALILWLSAVFWANGLPANSGNQNNFAHGILKEFNDSLCDYEGNLMEPVFYCTFENKKSVKICETFNDGSELNTFIFTFGDIGANSDLELVSEMKNAYMPGVVARTTIEQMKSDCTDTEGTTCETNHSVRYDFNDTNSQFLFVNGDFEYLVNVSSWLGSSFRAFEGGIVVNKLKRDLPSYHPGFRANLATFDCVLGSAKNTVWDGAYADKIIINEGLCWVNLDDEGGEWQTCLP